MGSYIIFHRPHRHYVEVMRVLHQRQSAQRAFSRKRRKITLTPEFEDAVWDRMDSGDYATTDEVLQACLGALELVETGNDYEWLERATRAGLERDRGQEIPGEQAIEMTRAELRRKFRR